ncbi:hypothetical protein BD309DRAFT_168464 [Dichomitus squalens]|nr:hypothetical protein BD309DRAFT_168464 [Dichomitus squalens]
MPRSQTTTRQSHFSVHRKVDESGRQEATLRRFSRGFEGLLFRKATSLRMAYLVPFLFVDFPGRKSRNACRVESNESGALCWTPRITCFSQARHSLTPIPHVVTLASARRVFGILVNCSTTKYEAEDSDLDDRHYLRAAL